jgi:hypothetical protein
MTIDLTAFPAVPESRTALTSAGTRQYITGPAWENFKAIEALLESVEARVLALPSTTRSASMPDEAGLYDLWVDASSNDQPKICTTAYLSGNGTSANWTSLRDATATAISTTVANSQSPSSTQATLLKNDITSYASDSSLSTEEREILEALEAEFETRNTEIVQAAADFSLTGAANYTTYTTAYSDWQTLGPLPANPLPANFAQVWNDLIDAEQAILATIRTTSASLLNTLNGDLTSVQNTIDDMASDLSFTPTEKLRIKEEYDRIQSEYTNLTTLATALGYTGASQYTTYQASYNALVTMVTTTYNLFGDMSATTTLPDAAAVTAWNLAWQTYYIDARAFDNYVDTTFKSSLDSFSTTLDGYDTQLTGITDDSLISGGTEKTLFKNIWDDIVVQNTNTLAQASDFSVTVPSAYTTAYNTLDTYINSTLGVFNNMTTDTAVDRNLMDTYFDNYRAQYGVLAAAISSAQANAISTAQPSNYTEYTGLVDDILDDNVISAGSEKVRFNMIWQDIQATHATFITQATDAGVSTTNLQTAYNDLSNYLLTTLTNFTILNVDTNANHQTVSSYFRTYETQKAVLTQDIISSALTAVRESVQTVADMNNDGVVTPIEKTTLKRIFDKYTTERDNAVTQADSLSITTEKDAMTTAYTSLDTYLDSLDGGLGIFNDMENNTNLTTAQNNDWDLKWFDFETKLQALLTAIQSTQVANNISTSAAAFKHDGSQPATGNWDLDGYKITDMADGTIASLGKDATTGGQLYTEQQARISGDATAESNANTYTDGEIATEVTNRNTAISTHNTASDHATNGAADLHGLGATDGAVVGADKIQTLTNKTINSPTIDNPTLTNTSIDADSVTISNLEADNLKASAKHTDFETDPADGNTSVAMAEGVYDKFQTVVTEAVAASTAAAGADFSAYRNDSVQTASTSYQSPLLGTGIDTSAGTDYTDSSFCFRYRIDFGEQDTDRQVDYTYVLDAIIKKASGSSTINVRGHLRCGTAGGSHNDQAAPIGGTLNASGNTVAMSPANLGQMTSFNIERLDSSNELCFRINMVGLSQTYISHATISGPRVFGGTEITPGQGTKF